MPSRRELEPPRRSTGLPSAPPHPSPARPGPPSPSWTTALIVFKGESTAQPHYPVCWPGDGAVQGRGGGCGGGRGATAEWEGARARPTNGNRSGAKLHTFAWLLYLASSHLSPAASLSLPLHPLSPSLRPATPPPRNELWQQDAARCCVLVVLYPSPRNGGVWWA